MTEVYCKNCNSIIKLTSSKLREELSIGKNELLTFTYVDCDECNSSFLVQADNATTLNAIKQMKIQAQSRKGKKKKEKTKIDGRMTVLVNLLQSERSKIVLENEVTLVHLEEV